MNNNSVTRSSGRVDVYQALTAIRPIPETETSHPDRLSSIYVSRDGWGWGALVWEKVNFFWGGGEWSGKGGFIQDGGPSRKKNPPPTQTTGPH